MDVLQTLFSLWTGNRCTPDQKDSVTEPIKKLMPEDQQEQFSSLLSEYCEKLERQAFDVGFKTAVQLWQQLDNTAEICGGIAE